MSESPSTTIGDKVTNFGQFNDTEYYFKEILNYGDHQHWNILYTNIYNLYHLNNVETEPAGEWKISDWVPILGSGGVFKERQEQDGLCNYLYWYEELSPEKGAIYTMNEDGPVEISFMFGGTDWINKFGYFYYTDDMTRDQILQTNRYILMEDGTPHGNIKYSNGESLNGGMVLPGLVSSYESNKADATLTGTTYKLVYFGQDGNSTPTYNFPKGTHVGFFIIRNGMDESQFGGYHMNYSLPWMDDYFYVAKKDPHNNNVDFYRFITYEWNGQIILGVEDTDDDDMNDILFFVNGEFEEQSTIPDINPDPIPEAQSFILAVEDLGNMDDFDFNDLVVEIAHASGQSTARATGLAAGGTLPINLLYNNTQVGPEFHSWFGINNTSTMINTGLGTTASSNNYTIEVPETFSMAYQEAEIQNNNMGGFTVVVTRSDGDTDELVAPNKGLQAPQMICLPGDWRWPRERQAIDKAYPSFTNWISDHTQWGWLTADDIVESLLYGSSSN